MTHPGFQKRKHARNPIRLEVVCNLDEMVTFESTDNLGLGGIFLVTTTPEPVGTRFELSFRLPGHEESIRVKSEVRWIQPPVKKKGVAPGMGLQFLDLNPVDEELLRKFFAEPVQGRKKKK